MNSPEHILQRLDDQIEWYDKRSTQNQRLYKWLKWVEIAAAAFIPFTAGFGAHATITGGLGVLVVILEGLQQINQFDHNWINYRSTCEALKHEKYLYLGNAGPYATAIDRNVLLVERVESLVSREHAKWVTSRVQATKVKDSGAESVS